MHRTARVLVTIRSRTAPLRLEFGIDVSEVFIRRDPVKDVVVLSRKPIDWQGLLDVVTCNKDEDLLIGRRQTHARRNPLDRAEE